MVKKPKTVNPRPKYDWYFREWCAALKIDHPHAWLQKEVGYSDGKASNVLTGKKRYDREILNEVAEAMKRQPFELLMHPDEAHAIMQLRASARAISAIPAPEQTPAEIVAAIKPRKAS